MLKELKRLWPMLAIIVSVTFYMDPEAEQLKVVAYKLSMLALAIVILHVGRKALFPYLKLEKAVSKALLTPIGSSLVWLGTIIFLATCIAMVVPR